MWLRATGKARWVKRAGLLSTTLLFLFSSILQVNGYVAVDTSVNVSYGNAMNTQRHIIYDSVGARWFDFYFNGTYERYRSSTNLVTWGNTGDVWTHALKIAGRYGTSDVKIYGSTVYVTAYDDTDSTLYFNNGTISGATITWNTSTVAVKVLVGLYPPVITRDSASRLWIITGYPAGPLTYALYSDNGGSSWTQTSLPAGISATYGGVAVSPMGATKIMVAMKGTVGSGNHPRSDIWTGAAWDASVVIDAAGTLPNDIGGFSLIADPWSADIQYFTYLDITGGNNIRFLRYNAGWEARENVSLNVDSDSYPVISYDYVHNNTVVAWIQSDTLFYRSRSSAGVWGAVTQIDSMILVNVASPKDLSGSIRDYNNRILYSMVTGNGVPYNLTVAAITYSTTTTTTTTVSTLTTQTTTADTIVDAVANQFAAVMENLFPALIIILVFVYLAYKAGASGEVLAYVFIITLVLTSFINLMPWWITVIVSVIMIAILLNYRQRAGGLPQ